MISSRPMHAIHCEAGFSFLEVLIASLVALVVMGGMYAGIEQTEVFWDAYQGRMGMRQQARVALDQIVDLLRMVGYDIGNVTEVLTQADDLLHTVRRRHR